MELVLSQFHTPILLSVILSLSLFLQLYNYNDVQELSKGALTGIEDTDPPLFLKFVNLLVNDANFLLDEALDVSNRL